MTNKMIMAGLVGVVCLSVWTSLVLQHFRLAKENRELRAEITQMKNASPGIDIPCTLSE